MDRTRGAHQLRRGVRLSAAPTYFGSNCMDSSPLTETYPHFEEHHHAYSNLKDLPPHHLSPDCWCRPYVEYLSYEEGVVCWRHNSIH